MSRHRRYPVRLARAAFGIRAQDLRVLSKATWWAKRWLSSLEAMRLGPRFGRGRQYAVSGQVVELVVDGGHVDCSVMGSRPDPYKVSMDFTMVQTPRIADALKRDPMLLARLLTDDLPLEVEAMFRDEGVPLFPVAGPLGKNADGRSIYDVKMHCACPDWARPCKHLVAALLILGEEIARRPAALLALRGVDVNDLVPPAPKSATSEFRGIDAETRRVSADVRPGAFLSRLGGIPFWRGGVKCSDAFTKICTRVRPVALAAADGKSVDLRAPGDARARVFV